MIVQESCRFVEFVFGLFYFFIFLTIVDIIVFDIQ